MNVSDNDFAASTHLRSDSAQQVHFAFRRPELASGTESSDCGPIRTGHGADWLFRIFRAVLLAGIPAGHARVTWASEVASGGRPRRSSSALCDCAGTAGGAGGHRRLGIALSEKLAVCSVPGTIWAKLMSQPPWPTRLGRRGVARQKEKMPRKKRDSRIGQTAPAPTRVGRV